MINARFQSDKPSRKSQAACETQPFVAALRVISAGSRVHRHLSRPRATKLITAVEIKMNVFVKSFIAAKSGRRTGRQRAGGIEQNQIIVRQCRPQMAPINPR